jgi:hypothetical protein
VSRAGGQLLEPATDVELPSGGAPALPITNGACNTKSHLFSSSLLLFVERLHGKLKSFCAAAEHAGAHALSSLFP